jgi:hypothetical protein
MQLGRIAHNPRLSGTNELEGLNRKHPSLHCLAELDTHDTKSMAGDISLILNACSATVSSQQRENENEMRKTTFATVAAGALIFAGIAGWITSNSRPLEAEASTAIEAQIDTFSMMASTKDLPTGEFQDFSFVFSAPVAEGRSSLAP